MSRWNWGKDDPGIDRYFYTMDTSRCPCNGHRGEAILMNLAANTFESHSAQRKSGLGGRCSFIFFQLTQAMDGSEKHLPMISKLRL
jgi:hypothetical protein